MPVIVLLIEVLAACLLPKNKSQFLCKTVRPSLAVLVPAHDEGIRIVPTLKDIKAQIGPKDRLLVVADNCSDDTASVARQAGAEVIERHDKNNLGKGYALDFGVRHLEAAPPEVLIIFDADCNLQNTAVDILAQSAMAVRRPMQALYLMHAPENSLINDQTAEFTWRLKNLVRPLGLDNLNLPCQLVGTGMAIPWDILKSVNLATGALTEDLKLGLDLSMKGHAPKFCPSALVTSNFASCLKGRKTQQERWEQGHREAIFSMGPRIFFAALFSRNLHLLAMALDLTVPPIFLLTLSLVALVSVTGTAALYGLSILPLSISSGALSTLMFTIAIAWIFFGRDALPLRSWQSIFPYLQSKMYQYARLLAGYRATTWIRTDRR